MTDLHRSDLVVIESLHQQLKDANKRIAELVVYADNLAEMVAELKATHPEYFVEPSLSGTCLSCGGEIQCDRC